MKSSLDWRHVVEEVVEDDHWEEAGSDSDSDPSRIKDLPEQTRTRLPRTFIAAFEQLHKHNETLLQAGSCLQ